MRLSHALLTLSLTAGSAAAQFPPDSTENLQVLPKDTPVREVINTMRGFAIGLGVRCEHCHIGDAGEPLSTFDFVSDDMPAKDKAREMLRMVRQINGEWLAALPKRGTPAVEVQCQDLLVVPTHPKTAGVQDPHQWFGEGDDHRAGPNPLHQGLEHPLAVVVAGLPGEAGPVDVAEGAAELTRAGATVGTVAVSSPSEAPPGRTWPTR